MQLLIPIYVYFTYESRAYISLQASRKGEDVRNKIKKKIQEKDTSYLGKLSLCNAMLSHFILLNCILLHFLPFHMFNHLYFLVRI